MKIVKTVCAKRAPPRKRCATDSRSASASTLRKPSMMAGASSGIEKPGVLLGFRFLFDQRTQADLLFRSRVSHMTAQPWDQAVEGKLVGCLEGRDET
jgi:hypothetical protein